MLVKCAHVQALLSVHSQGEALVLHPCLRGNQGSHPVSHSLQLYSREATELGFVQTVTRHGLFSRWAGAPAVGPTVTFSTSELVADGPRRPVLAGPSRVAEFRESSSLAGAAVGPAGLSCEGLSFCRNSCGPQLTQPLLPVLPCSWAHT